MTARERGRLEERLGERERIARELHDTLLQGVHGLILRLQFTLEQIDIPGEARKAINDELDRADALLIDGRDRVKNLRNATTAPTGLNQALLEAHERARRIRARINIWSRPGAGTEVTLTVPATMAYVRGRWTRRISNVMSAWTQ